MFAYPAVFRRDRAGRVFVRFVDLPHAATDGGDDGEAMAEAIDCLGSDLAFRIAGREEIPVPSVLRRGQRLVPVPLWLAPKLALYQAMRERKVSNTWLARRLGCTETVIRRMLDPDHKTKAERLEAALAALGKRLTVAVEDAA